MIVMDEGLFRPEREASWPICGVNAAMTYRGRFQNGVVVLDQTPAFEEGTVVEVHVVSAPAGSKARPSGKEALLRAAGMWEDQAEEIDKLLNELREMKQAELRASEVKGDLDQSL